MMSGLYDSKGKTAINDRQTRSLCVGIKASGDDFGESNDKCSRIVSAPPNFAEIFWDFID
jgi:hypothetical protein